MERFKKVTLEKNRRIIMISDIHGEKDLLIKLLNKVDFNDQDYLFLVVFSFQVILLKHNDNSLRQYVPCLLHSSINFKTRSGETSF